MDEAASHPLLTFFDLKCERGLPAAHLNLICTESERCLGCRRSRSEVAYRSCRSEVIFDAARRFPTAIRYGPAEDLFMKVVSDGRTGRWYDLLGSPDRELVVQERVVEEMIRARLTGFVAHPVRIEEIEGKKLKTLLPVPRYCVLEVTGRADIDFRRWDEAGAVACAECGRRSFPPGLPHPKLPRWQFPKMETWDGADFVLWGNAAGSQRLCTRRFIDLAVRHGWTNFQFGYWQPAAAVPYPAPDWFERTVHNVQAAYPEMFGREKRAPPPPPAPKLPRVPVEEIPWEVAMTHPRFDLLEARLGRPVPAPLRALYADRDALLHAPKGVLDLPLPEGMKGEGYAALHFDHFATINGELLGDDLDDELGLGGCLDVASDGSGGYYCIDPLQADPEVVFLNLSDGTAYDVGVPLSRFLAACRQARPEEG